MFLLKLENHLNRIYRWNLKPSINKWDTPREYAWQGRKRSPGPSPGSTNNYRSLKEEPGKGMRKQTPKGKRKLEEWELAMEARKEECLKKEVVHLSAVLRDWVRRGRSDCFTELSFLVNKSTRRASRPQGAEMTAKGEGSLVLWCPSSSTWSWRPGLNCFRSLYPFDFVSLSKVRQFS